MSDPDRADAPLPSTGLLSFYDRLRERIRTGLERRSSRLGPAAAEAILLVPDLFIFLVRLALDPEVPADQRRLIGGTLLYFVAPIDLLPEAFLGPSGFLDDLVLACAVLSQAFGRDLELYAHRYWNGSRRLGEVIGDVTNAAQGLLGGSTYERLKRALAKRGIGPAEAERREKKSRERGQSRAERSGAEGSGGGFR